MSVEAAVRNGRIQLAKARSILVLLVPALDLGFLPSDTPRQDSNLQPSAPEAEDDFAQS